MITFTPKVDLRNLEKIIEEIKELMPFYTPQWTASGESDPGVALMRVFARLVEGVIVRLNEVPNKNFIAFLDMLGIKLQPARSARVPLTFSLSNGAPGAVEIPPRTQAAANPPQEKEPVLFETEKTILATPAQIQKIYTVIPNEDAIFDHSTEILPSTEVELFTGENLQEHSIYLGHGDLFNIKNRALISLNIAGQFFAKLRNVNLIQWQYHGEREVTTNGEKAKIKDWYEFDSVTEQSGNLILKKNNNDEIKENEINEIKSFWIRCKVKSKKIDEIKDVVIDIVKVKVTPLPVGDEKTPGVFPDMAFLNDIPIDLGSEGNLKSFYPFGQRPLLFNTFYLASQDAFSKRGTTVTLNVDFILEQPSGSDQNSSSDNDSSEDQPSSPDINPILSWEYWNGTGWQVLSVVDSTANFTKPTEKTITFKVPDNIEKVGVIGQENYWIRARLISGDYGREVFKFDNQTGEISSELKFYPPLISKLMINYESEFHKSLDACLTLNNLTYRNHTELSKAAQSLFKPFLNLKDELGAENQALYIGFDQAPVKGPISLFFSFREQEYIEASMPRVGWEYFRKGKLQEKEEWLRLEGVIDNTKGLTETNTLEFIGPDDFRQKPFFTQNLYWIRGVNSEHLFEPEKKVLSEFLEKESLSRGLEKIRFPSDLRRIGINTPFINFIVKEAGELFEGGIQSSRQSLLKVSRSCEEISEADNEPCEALFEPFHPQFNVPSGVRERPFAPKVRGLYLNTAWAVQAETITDEILGSGDGTGGQAFNLTKFPVIEEEIWVNEFGVLPEGERKALSGSEEIQVEEIKDENGNIVEFWVLWVPVEDLDDAQESDRVYSIDRTFGQIQFGDGINGMALPIGLDNIEADYRAGGGAKGNLDKSLIKTLRTTIPFVDSVINNEISAGGSDTESMVSVLERGPQRIKNRGRAVTVEDFEWLTREASSSIARVKCLPIFNDQGQAETNWVTVIIVPLSVDARPTPTLQLRRNVEEYLLNRSFSGAAKVEHIQVTGPTYVEASVTAELIPVTIDQAPYIEAEAFRRLKAFLHPLTGGDDKRGWEFGRLPCLSDFYARLETIEGLDHVQSLSMTLQAITPTGERVGEPANVTEDQPLIISMPEYALVYSGEHNITVKPGR